MRNLYKVPLSRYRLVNYINGLLWGLPKPSGIMVNRNGEPLTFKKLLVVYPKSADPKDSIVKIWNVAVTTTEPFETCSTHDGWMLNIITQQAYLQSAIAEREHNEIEWRLEAYNKVGNIDRSTYRLTHLLDHEGRSFKVQ